jgi:pyridoxal biosynthesis lyase PdxS
VPLKRGVKNVGKNIRELHKGPQYAKTKAKHGTGVANRQAVAAAENAARKRKK